MNVNWFANRHLFRRQVLQGVTWFAASKPVTHCTHFAVQITASGRKQE